MQCKRQLLLTRLIQLTLKMCKWSKKQLPNIADDETKSDHPYRIITIEIPKILSVDIGNSLWNN